MQHQCAEVSNEIPRLHQHPQPGAFKLPGNPLRPRAVRRGVRDEEVPSWLDISPRISLHCASLPRSVVKQAIRSVR